MNNNITNFFLFIFLILMSLQTGYSIMIHSELREMHKFNILVYNEDVERQKQEEILNASFYEDSHDVPHK